jgi:DNA-directed RNA polymerase specialized sigma24 family protein
LSHSSELNGWARRRPATFGRMGQEARRNETDSEERAAKCGGTWCAAAIVFGGIYTLPVLAPLLVDMIARLSPADRQLVILWLEGLTMPEIEEVSGIRAGTVAVRLTRIRKRLTEMIESAEVRNG